MRQDIQTNRFQKSKELTKWFYEGNVEYLNYIIELIKEEIDSDSSRDFIIEFLEEIKENFVVLKQIIMNDKINGYYEVLRANIELLVTVKFFFKDLEYFDKKIKAYEYFQMKDALKLQKLNNTKIKGFESLCAKYGMSEQEYEEIEKELKESISENIRNLNDSMNLAEYDDIREKDKNEKSKKFYKYYTNGHNPNNFNELLKFLKEDRLYLVTYIITSQISHASNIKQRYDENLLDYTTTEKNNLLYFTLKDIIKKYLKETDVNKLKEWGERQFQHNFIDRD